MTHLDSCHHSSSARALVPEPKLSVSDAHTLTITHAGCKLFWCRDDDEASATINDAPSALTLNIHHSLSSPLIIANHTDKTLTITMEPGTVAHVVVLAQGDDRIDLNLAHNAFGYVYLVPDDDAHHISLTAHVLEHAQISLFEFGFGASTSVHDMTITLAESKAAVSYFGLDQLCGAEKKQSRLIIRHQGTETKSSQWFRGIYGGRAQGDFLGQVVIEKNASNSSAQQLYKSIVLTDRAQAHVKPELVIFNHDISASHGATIGELDQEALFYLRSRGLPMHEAKALLIESFIEEALLTIEVADLRKALAKKSATSTARLLGDNL